MINNIINDSIVTNMEERIAIAEHAEKIRNSDSVMLSIRDAVIETGKMNARALVKQKRPITNIYFDSGFGPYIQSQIKE